MSLIHSTSKPLYSSCFFCCSADFAMSSDVDAAGVKFSGGNQESAAKNGGNNGKNGGYEGQKLG